MNEIKASVSFISQGGIMLTQAEAKQLEKQKAGTGFITERITVVDKKGKSKTIHYQLRKGRPVTRSLNISKEAFEYMTSSDSYVPGIKPWIWNKLKPLKRFEAHLNLIGEDFNADSYAYKVFDD